MGLRRSEVLPGVTVTNDRCLILKEGPTAVVGDLHLGYESALESEGMFIPRINTESVRESLNKIIDDYEPQRIVLLGDVKHDFSRSKYSAREEVRSIVKLVSDAAETVVIKGNHDNYLQNILADLGVNALDYCDVMGYRLEHGHVDSGHRPVIIGHEHPSVRIRGEPGGSVKLQCYVVAKEGVIVIPPFSPLASGNDLNGAGEAVMAPALKGCDVSKADIWAVSEMGLIHMGDLDDVEDLVLRITVGALLHLAGFPITYYIEGRRQTTLSTVPIDDFPD